MSFAYICSILFTMAWLAVSEVGEVDLLLFVISLAKAIKS